MNGQPDNGISARHVIVRRTNVHDSRWAAAVAIAAADVVFEDGNVYNNFHVDPARDGHGIVIMPGADIACLDSEFGGKHNVHFTITIVCSFGWYGSRRDNRTGLPKLL
jgi:hypothetical protein